MPVQINYMYGTYVQVPSSERKVQHYDLVEHRPLNPVISANKITRTSTDRLWNTAGIPGFIPG